MLKIVIVLLVILAATAVETIVDKAIGIDFSRVSVPKRIVHGITYKLAGGAIWAAVWFS